MGHALLKSGCLGEGICVSPHCTILQLPAHSRLLILLNINIIGPVSFAPYRDANQNFNGGLANKAEECSPAVWKI